MLVKDEKTGEIAQGNAEKLDKSEYNQALTVIDEFWKILEINIQLIR